MPALDTTLGPGFRTVVEGLDHPEGVCWSPDEHRVYAGGEAGQLYRFSLDGGEPQLVTTVPGGFLLGLALDADGNIYACDSGNQCVQRISPSGAVEAYGGHIALPNYPAFDAEGCLWVSDSGALEDATGGLVRIFPGGRAERVDVEPFRFSNGLSVGDDFLYVVETFLPGVTRVPLAGGPSEPVVQFDRVVPDGLAFDVEGGLWISCYQPNRVYRLTPTGELQLIVDDWTGEYVLTPTNCAFAGDNLEVLVLASLCGWAVRAIEPGVRGRPLHYPTL
jgi:sugar lactone lactonase YvrE